MVEKILLIDHFLSSSWFFNHSLYVFELNFCLSIILVPFIFNFSQIIKSIFFFRVNETKRIISRELNFWRCFVDGLENSTRIYALLYSIFVHGDKQLENRWSDAISFTTSNLCVTVKIISFTPVLVEVSMPFLQGTLKMHINATCCLVWSCDFTSPRALLTCFSQILYWKRR